jgi:hypothetical protein
MGNVIQVTRAAFGMRGREHMWKLSLSEIDANGHPAWVLMADNISEIAAAETVLLHPAW